MQLHAAQELDEETKLVHTLKKPKTLQGQVVPDRLEIGLFDLLTAEAFQIKKQSSAPRYCDLIER